MKLILMIILALVALPSFANIQSHPQPDLPLQERWQWAQQQTAGKQDYVIGWEVTLPISEGLWLMGHGSWMNNVGRQRHSYAARLQGLKNGDKVRKLNRRLAVTFKAREGKLDRIDLSFMDAPQNIHGTLFWLGKSDAGSSLEQLISMYPSLEGKKASNLVRVVGFHDYPDTVSFLINVLKTSKDKDLREQATESLQFQSDPEADITLLKLARSEKDQGVRMEAIEALANIDSEEAFELLRELTATRHSQRIRAEAVESLGETSHPDALSWLRSLLPNEKSEDVADEIIDELSEDPDSFDLLAKTANSHPIPDAREEAMEAIADINPEKALPVLMRIAKSETDLEMGEAAVDAIGDLPQIHAVPALLQLLDTHPHIEIRAEAIDELEDFPEPRVIERINQIAWNYPNADLQEDAVNALAHFRTKQIQKLLLKIARKHTNPDIREEAIDALKDIAFDH